MNRAIDLDILPKIDFWSVTRSRTRLLILSHRTSGNRFRCVVRLNKYQPELNNLTKVKQGIVRLGTRSLECDSCKNNKYVDIHLPGWAVCVLIIRLTNNIHQHRFACMLTSTKTFLYEVTFCSPLKTGNRSSGCWLLRKEMIFLGELMLCVHTVVSSCLVCLRAAQTIHLLVVNLMAQYWRSAKEQNTSLWYQRDSFPDFMRHKSR